MINPDHMRHLPYQEALSSEEERMVQELHQNRAALSVINRLNFRIKRLNEQGFSKQVIDFDDEFPLLHESMADPLIHYFRLKGVIVTRVPRTEEKHPFDVFPTLFSFDWSGI